jgi:hypothetical protein
MLIITLKKNKKYYNSFSILLYNLGKRRPIKKLGKFFYNFQLNKFIFSFDFFFLHYIFYNAGVSFTFYFFKQLYKYVSTFNL